MDWSKHFPAFFPPQQNTEKRSPSEESPFNVHQQSPQRKRVEFADIGCGYGGLLVALSTIFPETLMLGT